MSLVCVRQVAVLFVACLPMALITGCSWDEGDKHYVRIHLENEGDAPVTFLAIGPSEAALETAQNRLSRPLPPKAVYSVSLSRPGNYWVRAEVETEGYTVERIEGPLRAQRGVLDWRFKEVDARPLYAAAAPYRAAGRISLSSN